MLLRLPIVLTLLLSLAAIALATPVDAGWLSNIKSRPTGRKCGSHLPSEVISQKEEAFASLLADEEGGIKVTATDGNFVIPVNFHVIYSSKDISGGYIP